MAGLTATIWGVADPHPLSILSAVTGALFAALFLVPLVSSCRTLRSRGLLLTPEGYEYNGCRIAWSDIAGITLLEDGEVGVTHVQVELARDVRLTGWAFVRTRLSCRLSGAPTVIPISDFSTDDVPLPDVLMMWWKRFRAQSPTWRESTRDSD